MNKSDEDMSCVELSALYNLLTYAGECAKEIGADDLLAAIVAAQKVAKKEMAIRIVMNS
ncbi:MAG: hypothetical protein AAGA74_04925 [Pseudomonadota bacterium]